MSQREQKYCKSIRRTVKTVPVHTSGSDISIILKDGYLLGQRNGTVSVMLL
jgi:hypothetical protein